MKKAFLVLFVLLASCHPHPPEKHLEKGRADIVSTTGDKSVNGTVKFVETKDGLRVYANVHGLPPGKHGFHIHEYGDIGNHGKNAGGHYNPNHVKHGFIVKDGYAKAHAGDFGNITIDENGDGELELFIPEMRLSGGKYNIAGRAVIIHENEDDFSQPTGNAGPRIAGGTIKIVE